MRRDDAAAPVPYRPASGVSPSGVLPVRWPGAQRVSGAERGAGATVADIAQLGDPDVALQQLRDGLIDVAVVFRYDDVPDDMRFTHLFDDAMYLLSTERGLAPGTRTPRGSRAASGAGVSACEGAGFMPRIMYTSDDPLVQQSMVASGLGVTTLPGLSVAQHQVPGDWSAALPVDSH